MVWFSAALWINYAEGQSGDVMEFHFCSVRTCARAKASKIHVHGTTVRVPAETIQIISSVDDCPECAQITLRGDGRSVIIMGSPVNWACRVWGGMHCVVRKEQND